MRHDWKESKTRGVCQNWICSRCGGAACTWWGSRPAPEDLAAVGVNEDCDLEAVREVLEEARPDASLDAKPDDPSWT